MENIHLHCQTENSPKEQLYCLLKAAVIRDKVIVIPKRIVIETSDHGKVDLSQYLVPEVIPEDIVLKSTIDHHEFTLTPEAKLKLKSAPPAESCSCESRRKRNRPRLSKRPKRQGLFKNEVALAEIHLLLIFHSPA